MADYVSIDQAAKILGISPDELVEMRSRGEIFGYRDGKSWKFKSEEIERVQSELEGDAMDEEAGGSSILVSERQVGPSGSKSGSTVGKAGTSDVGLGSDLVPADDSSLGSDVALVPDPKSGSGVRLVNRKPGAADGSSVDLDNEGKSASAISDLKLQKDGGSGSEVELGSDLKLIGDDSADESGLDLMGKDSHVLAGSGIRLQTGSSGGTPEVNGKSSGSIGLGADLELASDDEDDLVLGSDSGVGLASESGINLMSPSDSGLSLEDEPLDLAGTGISGLDLGAESGGSGSDVGSGLSGLGSGALIDFQQGEEFQLTPSSGGIEVDDDSGSQVIELEDSSEFGAMPIGPGAGGFGTIDEQGGFGGEGGFGDEAALASGTAGAALRGVPETPYGTLDVLLLMGILLLMGFGGLLVSDLMRNMWAWDGQNDYTSYLTSMLVNAVGGK